MPKYSSPNDPSKWWKNYDPPTTIEGWTKEIAESMYLSDQGREYIQNMLEIFEAQVVHRVMSANQELKKAQTELEQIDNNNKRLQLEVLEKVQTQSRLIDLLLLYPRLGDLITTTRQIIEDIYVVFDGPERIKHIRDVYREFYRRIDTICRLDGS